MALKYKFLLIGIGNIFRADEGAGRLAVEQFTKVKNIKIIVCDFLDPKYSKLISKTECAVFCHVFKAEEKEKTTIQEIFPDDSTITLYHEIYPHEILALTQKLYKYVPKSFLVKIPGINFKHKDIMSDITKKEIVKAVKLIKKIINQK